ncbi:MAG: membrane protein insertase YidC [Rickettsiales bacterium]|jgi:YidC/Oxa1 family membrane protein insertase|nr:membrane protein insertase YidC [Rickettsiales bacterium]
MVKYIDNKVSGFGQFQSKQEAAQKKGIGFFGWLVIICAAWFAASLFLTPKKQPAPMTNLRAEIAADVSNVPAARVDAENIDFHLQGLRISDIALKQYGEKLLGGENEFIEVGLTANGTTAPIATTLWKQSRNAAGNLMSWRNSDGVEFNRSHDISGYVITVRDTVVNKSRRDISVAPTARVVRAKNTESTMGVATGGIALIADSITRQDWDDLDKRSYAWSTRSGFIGFEDQYWETIAAVSGNDQTVRMRLNEFSRYQTDTTANSVAIPAGGTREFTTTIYAGPKNQSDLKTAAAAISGITRTIDYGWFGFLARPFLWSINYLAVFVANYGIAIILFTILLRIIMWPLTRKSFSSMAAMQKIQPEMQRIQKLYANDKIRQQQEMLKLYQTNKVSPMGGCLPMLLQIPIFFALYKALLISVPMRAADFLWMTDLAVKDPYFILPILMGATMWWQQRLQSASQSDSTNPMGKAMKYMPFIFTIMFAWMPAGLVLYWTVSNLFGILQMQVIKRNSGLVLGTRK